MSRHALVITGETMRAKAAYWLYRVPVGWRVEFKRARKHLSDDQMRRITRMLGCGEVFYGIR